MWCVSVFISYRVLQELFVCTSIRGYNLLRQFDVDWNVNVAPWLIGLHFLEQCSEGSRSSISRKQQGGGRTMSGPWRAPSTRQGEEGEGAWTQCSMYCCVWTWLVWVVCLWVKIIRMGNKHFSCHFLSVFIVTWSQNEPLESQEKNTQLTRTPRRGIALHCFFLLQIGLI